MKVVERTLNPKGHSGVFVRVTPYADGQCELVVGDQGANALARLSAVERLTLMRMLSLDVAATRQTLYLTVSINAQIGKDHYDVEVLPNGRVEATLQEAGYDPPSEKPIRFKLPENVEPTEALIAEFLTVRREGVRAGQRLGEAEVKLALRALLEVPSQAQMNDRFTRLRIEGDDD